MAATALQPPPPLEHVAPPRKKQPRKRGRPTPEGGVAFGAGARAKAAKVALDGGAASQQGSAPPGAQPGPFSAGAEVQPSPLTNFFGGSRIEVESCKVALNSALGPRSGVYWLVLQRFLLGRLSKWELDGYVKALLAPRHLPLHNDLILALLRNARALDPPPGTGPWRHKREGKLKKSVEDKRKARVVKGLYDPSTPPSLRGATENRKSPGRGKSARKGALKEEADGQSAGGALSLATGANGQSLGALSGPGGAAGGSASAGASAGPAGALPPGQRGHTPLAPILTSGAYFDVMSAFPDGELWKTGPPSDSNGPPPVLSSARLAALCFTPLAPLQPSLLRGPVGPPRRFPAQLAAQLGLQHGAPLQPWHFRPGPRGAPLAGQLLPPSALEVPDVDDARRVLAQHARETGLRSASDGAAQLLAAATEQFLLRLVERCVARRGTGRPCPPLDVTLEERRRALAAAGAADSVQVGDPGLSSPSLSDQSTTLSPLSPDDVLVALRLEPRLAGPQRALTVTKTALAHVNLSPGHAFQPVT
jgi:hypothetical protein